MKLDHIKQVGIFGEFRGKFPRQRGMTVRAFYRGVGNCIRFEGVVDVNEELQLPILLFGEVRGESLKIGFQLGNVMLDLALRVP